MRLPARATVRGLLLLVPLSAPIAAQSRPAASASADTSERRSLDLGGTLFTNFQYGGARDARSANRFELERAYLTARGKLNSRTSVRLTADVFQQRDAARDDFYGGWAFRAKYAYLQYDFGGPARGDGMRASGRVGMLPTVVIDQEEVFWPRWISNVALERAGFFSSADLGAAATLTLPDRIGHVYATVTNGPGYQSREADRYKDAGLRLTLTPFGRSEHPALKSIAISPWIYKGARASRFEDGAGSLAPVTDSRARDRRGVLIGGGSRSFTVGAHLAQRTEEIDSIVLSGAGDSTIAIREVDGRVYSAFAIARPFARRPEAGLRPLGLIVRYDDIADPELGADRQVVIAGLLWDAGADLSLALDYQEQTVHAPTRTSLPPNAHQLDTRVWYLHVVVNF